MPLKSYQRYAVTIVPIILIGLILYYFSDIVTYIVLAWTLSMVGAPINNFLRKWIGASGAAVATIMTFLLTFLVIVYLFIPPIVQQARNLTKVDYAKVINSFEEPINDWNQWLIKRGILEESEVEDIAILDQIDKVPLSHVEVISLDSILQRQDSSKTAINILINIPKQDSKIKDIENQEVANQGNFFERIRNGILTFFNPSQIPRVLSSIVGALGNVLITIMSVFFIAFFFLKEQGLFTKMLESIVPNDTESQWTHAIDESALMLRRYFSGVLLQIIVITILVSSVLKIFGFEYALLIGFFAALMNVIPYLGPILGGSFGIIITVSSHLDADFYGELLPQMGLIVLVFAFMQLLDNFILQPNIFSKSVKAHPLEIFLIILIGAKLGGILGMVIAIPLYTILRVLAKVFFSEFKLVQRITKGL